MKNVLSYAGRDVRPRRIEIIVHDDEPLIDGARLRNAHIVQGADCGMTPVYRKQPRRTAGCQDFVRPQIHRIACEDLDSVESGGEFLEISRQLRLVSQSRLVDIELLILEQIDGEGDFVLR